MGSFCYGSFQYVSLKGCVVFHLVSEPFDIEGFFIQGPTTQKPEEFLCTGISKIPWTWRFIFCKTK